MLDVYVSGLPCSVRCAADQNYLSGIKQETLPGSPRLFYNQISSIPCPSGRFKVMVVLTKNILSALVPASDRHRKLTKQIPYVNYD